MDVWCGADRWMKNECDVYLCCGVTAADCCVRVCVVCGLVRCVSSGGAVCVLLVDISLLLAGWCLPTVRFRSNCHFPPCAIVILQSKQAVPSWYVAVQRLSWHCNRRTLFAARRPTSSVLFVSALVLIVVAAASRTNVPHKTSPNCRLHCCSFLTLPTFLLHFAIAVASLAAAAAFNIAAISLFAHYPSQFKSLAVVAS